MSDKKTVETPLKKKVTKKVTAKPAVETVNLLTSVGKVVKKEPKTGLKVYTKNPSFKEVSTSLKKTIATDNVVISHGSRTLACVEACEKAIKDGGIVLNHPNAIRIASNKLLCKEVMKKGNVPTTPFQSIQNTSDAITIKYPVVAKLKSGSGGKGMYLINTPEEMDSFKQKEAKNLQSFFLEEMFNPRKEFNNHVKTTREFRVHFSPWLMGVSMDYVDTITTEGVERKEKANERAGVIFMTKKLSKPNAEGNFSFGKNISTGNAYFVRDLGTMPPNAKNLIIQKVADLMNILELDYAAVDVQYCEEKNLVNVLEVNTAPGFGEGEGITAGRYKVALKEIIAQKKAAF